MGEVTYAEVGKVDVQSCQANVMIETGLYEDGVGVFREVRYEVAIGVFQDAPLLRNDLSSDLERNLYYQDGCVESSGRKVGVLIGNGVGFALDGARWWYSYDGLTGDEHG
jgi:hypothetical protein